MGFLLTILYLVTAYLGPTTVFGPLAAIHIQQILAGLALLVSLPKLSGSFISATIQSWALVGLAFAIALSLMMTGWFGGALAAFLNFIPSALTYFLVCLHCDSKKKLQALSVVLLFICMFVIVRGYNDLNQEIASGDVSSQTMDRPYLMAQQNNAGEWFYRIKGQDFISDPNDFAQLIVCTIPLVFFLWKPTKTLRNIVVVLLPVCALLYGVFLTHSRGAILAILAMTVMAGRRRVGTVPSLLLSVGIFAGATALNFAGGRDISIEGGSDRLDLWGEGLEALKSHPLFGVGFGNLGDYTGGLTAHNSVVVCASELGLVGLYFWSLFLFPTGRDILAVSSSERLTEGKPIHPDESGPYPTTNVAVDREEVARLGQLTLISLVGFMVAGWFLSRAFVMTLFVLGGMAEVVFEMARRREMVAARLPSLRVLRYSGGMAVALLIVMYAMLRVANLTH